MPTDGYMDAAAVPVPDAGDDTLREGLAQTLYEGWRERNPGDLTWETESEWRRDEFRSWLEPLLPRIREHVAAAHADRDGWHAAAAGWCARAGRAEAAVDRVSRLADRYGGLVGVQIREALRGEEA